MKFSRLVILLVLVGLTASAAMADGIDPTVVIRQVDPPPIAITDPFGSFSFLASTGTGIQNETGLTLVSISLTFFTISPNNDVLDFNAGPQIDGIFPFTSSSKTVNPFNGSTTLTFFGLDETHLGILSAACNEETNTDNDHDADDCSGPIYSIEVDGIPPGDLVVGVATVSAPEPATLMLLSAGLVGLAAFRKRSPVVQN